MLFDQASMYLGEGAQRSQRLLGMITEDNDLGLPVPQRRELFHEIRGRAIRQNEIANQHTRLGCPQHPGGGLHAIRLKDQPAGQEALQRLLHYSSVAVMILDEQDSGTRKLAKEGWRRMGRHEELV